MNENKTGTLYLCATPIGNLEDITFRVLRTLKEVDLIAAEDTRNSIKLLNHFEIKTPMTSYHEYNKIEKAYQLMEKLRKGQNIALISDAGTPGISDPGFFLVREAAKAGIDVFTLPGATAFVPALVTSGMPCDRFAFEGFLPQKKGRQTKMESLRYEQRTMIFYESPRRLVKTLNQMAEVFGAERPACVCREISKIHEDCQRGTLSSLAQHFSDQEPRGEIVLIVGGADPDVVEAQKEVEAVSSEDVPRKKSKYQLKRGL